MQAVLKKGRPFEGNAPCRIKERCRNFTRRLVKGVPLRTLTEYEQVRFSEVEHGLSVPYRLLYPDFSELFFGAADGIFTEDYQIFPFPFRKRTRFVFFEILVGSFRGHRAECGTGVDSFVLAQNSARFRLSGNGALDCLQHVGKNDGGILMQGKMHISFQSGTQGTHFGGPLKP